MQTQRKEVHIDLRSHVELSLLKVANEHHAPALAAPDAAMASSSSTGPMQRRDTLAATRGAASSDVDDTRTNANAARQGLLALRIATSNVGDKSDILNTAPERK